MRFLLTILATLLLIAAAHAQHRTGGTGGVRGPDPAVEASKKRNADEIDRAYKATMDRMPSTEKPDPWGNVRNSDAEKAKKK